MLTHHVGLSFVPYSGKFSWNGSRALRRNFRGCNIRVSMPRNHTHHKLCMWNTGAWEFLSVFISRWLLCARKTWKIPAIIMLTLLYSFYTTIIITCYVMFYPYGDPPTHPHTHTHIHPHTHTPTHTHTYTHTHTQGVMTRDQIVFEEARKRKIPIFMVTSGGYQVSTMETVRPHCMYCTTTRCIS